jgi:serine/threonine protein kinase
MKYLHSQDLFYLWLKPSNILFDEHGYPVIGDTCNGFFFETCQMEGMWRGRARKDRYAPSQDESHGRNNREAWLWFQQIDVYGFGAIVCEMLFCESGSSLQEGESEDSYSEEQRNHRREVARSLHPFLGEIIAECLDEDPNNRPTFSTLEARLRARKYQIYEDVSTGFTSRYLERISICGFPTKWSSSIEGKRSRSQSIRIYSEFCAGS